MGDTSDESDSNNDVELYTYAGCYKNKNRGQSSKMLLKDGPHPDNQMSAEICYKICTKGNRFNYFGTQNEGDCYCGEVADIESYNTYKRDTSQCNNNCNGNDDEKCGSTDNASVYKLKVQPTRPSTKMTTTSVFPPVISKLPRDDPGYITSSASERGNETKTPTKGLPTHPGNNATLAGIGIGVSCVVVVAICCVIILRRRLLRKQNRERSNTYRNAADMSVTGNQNEQRQGNSFSYTELIVYNHNHAYDELQIETNDTINGKVEVLVNSEAARVSNDNYTVLVVPEDQNSTLVTNTSGFSENISDNKALNKTNPIVGAYAILDPKETGFDRTKPEQNIKADSYAVLDPAETGFDRTKDRDEVPIQLVKHENCDKALQKHATNNRETTDEMKNQNGGTHSITMKNKIESIENKANKKASKRSNIGIGAYDILDPDATGFDRTKSEPNVNDDSYTVLDPAETGFDRTKHRDDMHSQSLKIENSGKSIQEHAIQNHETSEEGNYILNKDGQYDILNQVCRPKDDNEHTYSHSVDDVYDTTNQNRSPRTEDSSHAYDHL
ncbi:Hypothetical predicted protein [Mytilus galloprovincialis]|uniref:WSC domain-containing protein n=1 Tax=Mytilus galloprovincialis TaxID=29158 RepID=A0A8B6BQL0_MYTGA|nr:Hypothetical predicted protein [Mytilus galloprovincialis]